VADRDNSTYRLTCIHDLLTLTTEIAENVRSGLLRLKCNTLAVLKATTAIFEGCRALKKTCTVRCVVWVVRMRYTT
jgi:hypothetical protein